MKKILNLFLCCYIYERERESVCWGGEHGRTVDWKPRPRESRVMFHSVCLGSLGKCDFLILDNSWDETSSGLSVLETFVESLTRSST